MHSFQCNIKKIYGDSGKVWLAKLPKLVAKAGLRFDLHDLKPVSNLTYNYVLEGFQGDVPIILKLGFDSKSLSKEACALKCFANFGAVNLIAEDEGLLLLERAVPGTSLKSYFPSRDQEAIKITCDVMKNLHQANINKNYNFPHIKDWLSVLDTAQDIPAIYLEKAIKLRNKLLACSTNTVLLHGDLHHDNIIKSGDAWVVIDPKGIIGEREFEVAAFIRNPILDLLELSNATSIIKSRIDTFAKGLNVSPNRIADWCFVQTILAWAWRLEDNCDPTYFQNLIQHYSW